jgi:hypothetical protein
MYMYLHVGTFIALLVKRAPRAHGRSHYRYRLVLVQIDTHLAERKEDKRRRTAT